MTRKRLVASASCNKQTSTRQVAHLAHASRQRERGYPKTLLPSEGCLSMVGAGLAFVDIADVASTPKLCSVNRQLTVGKASPATGYNPPKSEQSRERERERRKRRRTQSEKQ